VILLKRKRKKIIKSKKSLHRKLYLKKRKINLIVLIKNRLLLKYKKLLQKKFKLIFLT